MADTVKPLSPEQAEEILRLWNPLHSSYGLIKALATGQHVVVEAVELNELREKAWKYEGLCS